MTYTQRKIIEARERIVEIRSRPCPHNNVDWSYIVDYCWDCGARL